MFDRDRRGPGESPPTLDRWTVNLSTGAVATERRDDRPQEFPRINESLAGAKHRFGYTVGAEVLSDETSDSPTSLYKHDYATDSTRPPRSIPSCSSARCASCRTRRRRAEDDGVLMGYAYHRGRDEGQLLIVDAQTLEPMATVHLPQRVPMGFHGNWAPAS